MYCANGYPALLVKFEVCWNYLWCICTHEVDTCFEISNIFRNFAIFAS